MRFSSGWTLLGGIEFESTLGRVKDLSDLSTTRKRLMLTVDIAKRNMNIQIGCSSQGILSLDLKVRVGKNDQLDVAFSGKQVTALIISPTERLLGDAVRILSFPPSQIVADSGLRAQRVIGTHEIPPLLLPDDAIDDQPGNQTR
jgi:hypothetical protein